MESQSPSLTFLQSRSFVAFDTETTGLWALSNRIVEIAAVRFRIDSDEIEEFQSLVNPGRSIPAEVTAIHGITDAIVREAPTSPEALSRFIEFCGTESILVAHNAPFDISFIGNELDRAGLPYPLNPVLDTVDIYRRYFPGQPSYSLLFLSQSFDMARTQEHRGLSDAHLVRRLLKFAIPKLSNILTVADLSTALSVFRMSDWRPEPATLPSSYADLTQALEQRLAIEIVYQASDSAPSSRVIRPLQVHRLGNVHYIIAFCERVQAERTFRLDRIISCRLVSE